MSRLAEVVGYGVLLVVGAGGLVVLLVVASAWARDVVRAVEGRDD